MTETWAILLVALLFLIMGLAAIFRPDSVLKVFGIKALPITMNTEIRAVYGGYGIAMVFMLLLALLLGGSVSQGIYLTIGAALLGMAIGRVISAAFDGILSWFALLFLIIELVAAGVLFYAAWKG